MKRVLLSAILLAAAASAAVEMKKADGRVDVVIGGKPFTTFFFGPDAHKPYLHPLRTAEGLVVTRSFPMESGVEGETKDHPHHQGLWFTHGDVNGLDFWANSKLTPKHGRVVLDRSVPMRVQGGAKTGMIQASFNWVTPDGKTLVKEERRMTFYDEPGLRTVDVDVTLNAAGQPVKFGDTKEGTFAIRISDKMTEKAKGGVMTSSTGATTMKEVWGKPFPWVDYAGTIDGTPVGITIMDHPQNPGHPTHWHARDYGLFAANIFGHHDFYRDKTKDGSASLEPGKPWRFRYRVVVHPGLTGDAKIGDLFDSYVRANFN
ncbi:MAG TPA: PmoA family protein [Bryobacteraceae bacterium]|nr:PmoA family protein [Bryobacteraceae bacterium]